MVVSLTYNHAPYIEDTLKGILMQQVDFPIVACVLDDCSIDGTADIVRRYEAEYPDLIKGFYFEENQYSQGKFTYEVLKTWLPKVKYIALCEGDDYWTDSLKLQKQVDFMESHQDCTMCFHRVTEHWQDNSAPDKIFFPVEYRTYTGTEIFKQWVLATCSVMVRSDAFKDPRLVEIIQNKRLMYYDQALFMHCATEGKVVGLCDVMGVYRRVKSGYTLQMWNDIKSSFAAAWRCCLHYATMKEIFGERLGDEFTKEAKSKFVGFAMYSALRFAKVHEIKKSMFFVGKSFSYYPLDTILWHWNLLKKQIHKIV